MKTRLTTIGWVFLMMTAVSYFGIYLIRLFHIQNTMLQNALGTIMLTIPAVLYLIFQDMPPEGKKLRFHILPFQSVLLIVVAAIALEMVSVELNLVTSLFFSNTTTDAMIEEVTGTSFLTSLLCVGVLPAIFEELAFRGAFFQEIRRAYGAWAGILMSGFLFGLYHMNMRQFAYAFLCGVFFGILVEVTDSIEASMLLHFIMNTLSCIVMYAASSFTAESLSTEIAMEDVLRQLLFFLPVAVMGLGLMIIVVIGLSRVSGRSGCLKDLFSGRNIKEGRRLGSDAEIYGDEFLPWRHIVSVPMILAILMCLNVIIAVEMA